MITAPQMALWNIWEAIQGGDQSEISIAVQNGFDQVSAALTQFPQAVLDTLSQASGDATGGLGAAAGDWLGDISALF